MVEFDPVTQEPAPTPRPRPISDTQITGLVLQTGCLVFLVVIGTVLGGILLDRVLNTRPLFTLLLVLGSVPVTLYVLYRLALRTASKVAGDAAPVKKGHHVDDDEA